MEHTSSYYFDLAVGITRNHVAVIRGQMKTKCQWPHTGTAPCEFDATHIVDCEYLCEDHKNLAVQLLPELNSRLLVTPIDMVPAQLRELEGPHIR